MTVFERYSGLQGTQSEQRNVLICENTERKPMCRAAYSAEKKLNGIPELRIVRVSGIP